jgi:hypothetical protein
MGGLELAEPAKKVRGREIVNLILGGIEGII